MKVWYHVIAGIVGLALAALIVYLVFGSASKQAAQDGAAPRSLGGSSEVLCGTITPAEANSPAARAKARDNLPALFDDKGPISAIRDDQPAHKAWMDRVHAASGFCMDEIHIEPSLTTLAMSTVESISADDADAFAAGAIAQAFTAPINPTKVELKASVDGSAREAIITRRAWNAYQARRKQLGLPHSMANLADFRRAGGYSRADLRIVGWG